MINKLPAVSFFKVLKNAKQILKNPLPFHEGNFKRFGDTFRIQLGFGKEVLITRDAEFAKHVLQKQHKKYFKSELQTKDLGKYLGKGLLTINGNSWLKQRRLIQPAFHKKKLEILTDTIKETVLEQLERIQPNKEQDLYEIMNDLAFQVVAKALFSTTDLQDEMRRLQEITAVVQKMLIKEIRQPYKKWLFSIRGDVKKHLDLMIDAKKIIQDVIDRRISEAEEKHDLLDMLLNARYEDGSKMSQEQLIDEILVFFIAGHETTSNALSFMLILLGLHPEVQQKCYEEVFAVKDTSSAFEQIKGYNYIKKSIEETLRLYPPAYFTDRLCIEDDEYKGIQIPKGTNLLISFYEIHRHEEYWKQANQFDPERFNVSDKKQNSEYYFPFGAGPRMCIGNNFAMYEMMITIAELVKQYEIVSLPSQIAIEPLITLGPKSVRLLCKVRK